MNKDFIIIDSNDDFKEVFKSFKLLDDIDVIDHPAVYKFATIIINYMKMINKLEDEKPNTNTSI